jgi:hypothetical protein
VTRDVLRLFATADLAGWTGLPDALPLASVPPPEQGAGGVGFLGETFLGRLRLEGGKRVYASRGLALRVNPENGVLLGAVGFAPTDTAEYRARLRPEVGRQRLLPNPAALGSAS